MPRRLSRILALASVLLPAAVTAGPLPGLIAAGPASGGYPGVDLFMPLLGHWDYSYRFYTADGKVREEGAGTWDFSWILGGRSIQDVQTFRSADGKLQEFGTTLRIPRPDASRIRVQVPRVFGGGDSLPVLIDGRRFDVPAASDGSYALVTDPSDGAGDLRIRICGDRGAGAARFRDWRPSAWPLARRVLTESRDRALPVVHELRRGTSR